ncbi:universal stress protein [Streptomyces sp. NBC_01102]|uniref:universal stress protein n=1 Tax=unclassified Streptomyces TaxID=2593676 RepID=UPI00386E4761|nr:universal stress protein [Streptomyces sp. NBC_01102]
MSHTVSSAGIDSSRESLAAANRAADEALPRGCPLRPLHVWRDGDAPAARYTDPGTEQRSAEALLHRAAEQGAEPSAHADGDAATTGQPRRGTAGHRRTIRTHGPSVSRAIWIRVGLLGGSGSRKASTGPGARGIP